MINTGLTICKVCEKEVSPDAKFCPNCGAQNPAMQADELIEHNSKQAGIAIWLALGALFFVFIFFYDEINPPE